MSGRGYRRQRLACVGLGAQLILVVMPGVIVMFVVVMRMRLFVIVRGLVMVVPMVAGIVVMFGVVTGFGVGTCVVHGLVLVAFAFLRMGGLRRLQAWMVDDLALDALAAAAAGELRWRGRRPRLERFSLSSSASRWARSSASIRACRSATGIW